MCPLVGFLSWVFVKKHLCLRWPLSTSVLSVCLMATDVQVSEFQSPLEVSRSFPGSDNRYLLVLKENFFQKRIVDKKRS